MHLDQLAGATPYPAVVEEMGPFFGEAVGSPSSVHSAGLRARRAVEAARERAAALIGASAGEIIFTSGGTEAANLAVKGAALAGGRQGGHIVTTAVEHPAVAESVRWLEGLGFSVARVGVDAKGRVDPDAARAAMRSDTVLVAVHHAQHDVGTVQPVEAIARMAREGGAVFFCDGGWSGGWVELDVGAMGCDLLSVAPSRFGGPQGVGILYRRRGVRLAPLLHGGMQEQGLRAGTENVAAIVGGGRAALEARADFAARVARVRGLQRRLAEGLTAVVPGCVWNGPAPGAGRAPQSLSFSLAGIEGEALALACDLKGLLVGASTSCISRSMKFSAALLAMGQPEALARGHLLMGMGRDTNDADVDFALEVLPAVAARLRAMSPARADFAL